MSNNPYQSPDTTGGSPPKPRRTLPKGLFVVLSAIAIIVLVIAILIPASRRGVPNAARRIACVNNLKQIALALDLYASVYQSLPPAYTEDADGHPLHSWRTLILPYMEQDLLYDKIDLSKPWDDPVNKEVYETPVSMYQCPSANCDPLDTTYMAIVTPDSCLRPGVPRPLSDITDDHKFTLLVVEVTEDHYTHWMAPSDIDEQWIDDLLTSHKSAHPNGMNVAFVAGNTRFLSSDGEASTIRAMISIAGNDDQLAQETD